MKWSHDQIESTPPSSNRRHRATRSGHGSFGSTSVPTRHSCIATTVATTPAQNGSSNADTSDRNVPIARLASVHVWTAGVRWSRWPGGEGRQAKACSGAAGPSLVIAQHGDAATDQTRVERRRHVARSARPVVAPCRHCARPQIIAVTRIVIRQGEAWHRCRACEELSLLRWEDAVALGQAASDGQWQEFAG